MARVLFYASSLYVTACPCLLDCLRGKSKIGKKLARRQQNVIDDKLLLLRKKREEELEAQQVPP